ncbi:ExbD/TolR family protein [Thiosocius teredinicola]|uniref:ExbD/TolR family protein n=1 Tax=Thiosocius teredinicola TaxID=1973002 RepID=UPI000990FA12
MLPGTAAPHKRRSDDDALIPMINIVFLLLVFFMIAGQINAYTEDELNVPGSTSDEALVVTAIDISIDATGVMRVNGEIVAAELDPLLDTLEPDENTAVVCRVHQALPASALDPVLRTVRRLGITQLRIATETIE